MSLEIVRVEGDTSPSRFDPHRSRRPNHIVRTERSYRSNQPGRVHTRRSRVIEPVSSWPLRNWSRSPDLSVFLELPSVRRRRYPTHTPRPCANTCSPHSESVFGVHRRDVRDRVPAETPRTPIIGAIGWISSAEPATTPLVLQSQSRRRSLDTSPAGSYPRRGTDIGGVDTVSRSILATQARDPVRSHDRSDELAALYRIFGWREGVSERIYITCRDMKCQSLCESPGTAESPYNVSRWC